MYHLGIDLGGTNVAAGLIKDGGKPVLAAKAETPTRASDGLDAVAESIHEAFLKCLDTAGATPDDIADVGVGFPGSIDRENGILQLAVNIPCLTGIRATDLFPELRDKKVFVENDANAAALGEFAVSAAENEKDMLMVTLGTGVGCGMIIDGRIYAGFNNCAGEAGHMVIHRGGRFCTCGRSGCFERYASATGLIITAAEEMMHMPDSIMWEMCGGDTARLNGRIPFDAMRAGDTAAKLAVDRYIGDLGTGIINLINIIEPQLLVIGGGIAREGETLLEPLRRIFEKERFVTENGYTRIIQASCPDSGALGAALLYTQER